MVQDSVLSRIASRDLAVYVVWEPIFKSDDLRASRRATVLFPDDRVTHYWASTLAVGKLFQAPLGLQDEVAWDVYLVYRPGRDWSVFGHDGIDMTDRPGREWEADSPPVPDDFMHQLEQLPVEKRLDGGFLAAWILGKRQP